MKIEKVDFCTECNRKADECICEENEMDCCPRCEIMMEVIDSILMAEGTEEALEILSEFVDIVEKSAFDAGYVSALKEEAESLMDFADELENED